MRLIPKAKPVRIRIVSGGDEHHSIHTLRENFVWSDIQPLVIDGRLKKWLSRIGEDEISERLAEVKDARGYNVLKVYNLLFRKSNPFRSVEDVYKEACIDKSLNSLIYEISKDSSYKELIRLSSKFKSISFVFFDLILQRAKSFSGEESPQQLYEIGKFILDNNKSGDNAKFGFQLIGFACDKEYEPANSFYRTHFHHDTPKNGKAANKSELVDAYHNLLPEFLKNWGKKSVEIIATNDYEEELIKFYNAVSFAYWHSQHDFHYRTNPEGLGPAFFGGLRRSNILFPLYSFIKALLSSASVGKSILQGISNYPPAYEMLSAPNNVYQHAGLYLQLYNVRQNISQLKKVIVSLEVFLKDVKINT